MFYVNHFFERILFRFVFTSFSIGEENILQKLNKVLYTKSKNNSRKNI